MVDLLPEQTRHWQNVEAVAREHFRRAGLEEIRTPLLEVTDLFARGIGEATDVVGKEMYSFLDRGERSCTLRPEGTASVVRAAIQHGLLSQGVQKLWYSGPMFRYERPQAGRQRQFHQIGVECLGASSARSDVETIALAWDLLADLGLTGLTLELNTLGTADDRKAYRNTLVSWLEERSDQLDADSQKRLTSNPLRILDSKNPTTQALLNDAPTLQAALSADSASRFEEVQRLLAQLSIPFTHNTRLVRGLDYYGHTAFEITSQQLGAQATVCGGGQNQAFEPASTVAGGELNMAMAGGATIVGGANNMAVGMDAVVVGGIYNKASGDGGVVAGGEYNVAANLHATVVGGVLNAATHDHGVVAGGTDDGNFGVVVGGGGEEDESVRAQGRE